MDNGGSQSDTLEEVVVTGSLIKRAQGDEASPVRVIGRENLEAEANISIADISMHIPSNVGSEVQANIFRQNFSAGTAPMNLRGLGLNSTLVLVDGRRITQSAAYGQDGSSFVDLNSIPSVMLDRVEILEDGAAATYGSDAVAGVANFITRENFEGFEVSGAYQKTTDGPQSDADIGAIFGRQFGNTSVVLGANYFKRESLPATDRGFTSPEANEGVGYSAAGQPGNYVLASQPGPPVPDPDCEASNGYLRDGLCRFDYIAFNELYVPETRLQAMLNVVHDLSDTTELYGSVLVARNTVDGQILPPSLPTVIAGSPDSPAIAADHPDNPFNDDVLVSIARPFGANSKPGVIDRDNDTTRVVLGIKGELSDWSYDTAYQYSKNSYSFNYPDVRRSRLAAALVGEGGPDNNEYFNPFALSDNNSQSVIDDIRADAFIDGEAELQTLDAVASRDLWEMGGGNAVIAIGGQWRNESLSVDYSDDFESYDLAYLVGATDYDVDRNVYALFSEVALPVSDSLEVQLALRYERYDKFGSSVDPKAAFRWQALDNLVVRGSASTAFRTPSLLQAYGNLAAVNDFPGSQFRADLSTGNPDLDNEEADVYNFGLVFTPTQNLTLSVDYWRFDYSDVISKENAQNIYTDWTGNGASCDDSRIILAEGSPTSGNCTANFVAVNTNFFNAATMETDGLDFSLDYVVDTAIGELGVVANATKILNYDITESNGEKIDALDRRNYFNFARSNQDLRGNIGFSWRHGAQSAQATVRYIDSYKNDQFDNANIDSQTTVDLQYQYEFEDYGLTLTAGMMNAFDEDPPHVKTNFGFDTQTHDPRGRIAYVRFKKRF